MKLKFEGLVYPTQDLGTSLKFYIESLGLEQEEVRGKKGREFQKAILQAADGSKLWLVRDEGGADGNCENFHVCWDVKDVGLAAEALCARGVQCFDGPPALGQKLHPPFRLKKGKCGCPGLYFLDPAGNSVEFHQLTPYSLQKKSVEEICTLLPLISANEYIPEAKDQGTL